jgi:hypothetical protein
VQFPPVDDDIPYADYPPTFADLRERVSAALNSLNDIADAVEVTDEDIVKARVVFREATGPDSKVSSATNSLLATPGTLVHVKALLDEYDKAVVQTSVQIRNYVTNRLLMDSNNPDPRVRIRCYELLGKISDVGLFTDKTEVTMRHRPTEELEQLLRERLMKTLDADVSYKPD